MYVSLYLVYVCGLVYASYLLSSVPVAKNDGGAVYEARIEDGKLYYENRA